jgi:hypothetical protein
MSEGDYQIVFPFRSHDIKLDVYRHIATIVVAVDFEERMRHFRLVFAVLA